MTRTTRSNPRTPVASGADPGGDIPIDITGIEDVRTLDRREGPYGEVVLRERGEHFEIIANGCFLMDTSDGRSERLLIDVALAAL